ncbi:SDR family oxidoreductase [Acinetobacter pittii]|uniref:SDR family oxidoreductase n=1 Tax=Acinetobacter pittii TaxID=48296 RepID=UPI002DB8A719|nr:SDR family oxidoreductase [Acinetobacter pittii]MEB6623351.1 SDR family oxidoreductase [Acinetobacter pittii]
MSEKVAIVTAAGSGMGAAIAKKLAADGFNVAILSSSGKGEALANQLNGLGITGSNQSIDDVQRLIDETLSRWGRIDVLVNSAGHGPRKEILELTDQDWHDGIDTYFLNAVRPIRLVIPVMQKQKQGVIINISSAWTFEPSSLFPTSAVARSGLAAFTKICADTYAIDNIRINNVLPGWIDTQPETDERINNVPMKRYGSKEEIADTVAFLASYSAAYITGQNIRVDGGLTRSV